MQFQPSSEQRALAASMHDAINAILPCERWHQADTEGTASWAELAALGIFLIAQPEEAGGLGLGAVEETLIAMRLGAQLAGPSVFATLGAVHAAPIEGQQLDADSRVTAALIGTERTLIVPDPFASHALVRNGQNAHIVPIAALAPPATDNPWLDPIALSFEHGAICGDYDDQAVLRLALLDAAALAGLADCALSNAVEYSKIREQFGRPIGSFQAIKHHCANMAVAAHTAQDMVTFAAVAVDHGSPDAAFLVNSAFVTAAQAAVENAGLNIQIHGGMGFSAEANAHLIVKRAQMLVALGGGIEAALDRVACTPASH